MNLVIPITKTCTYTVPNGEIRVTLEESEHGSYYEIYYHNKIFTKSPFKFEVYFLTKYYTLEQVMASGEFRRFMRRFE